MANNARFIVTNALNKEQVETIGPNITVKSKRLEQEKIHDPGQTISQWQGYIPDTETRLEIQLPQDVDLKNIPFKIQSGVDLNITYSRSNSSLTIQIAPNDLPPELPLTVNVSMGEEDPPPPPPQPAPAAPPKNTTNEGNQTAAT